MNEQEIVRLVEEQKKKDMATSDHDLLVELKVLVGVQNGRIGSNARATRKNTKAIMGISLLLAAVYGPKAITFLMGLI